MDILIKVPQGIAFSLVYNALSTVFKVHQDSTPEGGYVIVIDGWK